MVDDEELEEESYLEPEDIYCNKCGKLIVLPKYDGPYEYYETDGLQGLLCPSCGKPLCDECANWQKSILDHSKLCFDCFNEERHSNIDLSIHNAIVFAARKHKTQLRKSTDIPYIAHLMEVMQILIENNCEKNVIIAGILHDTLEDTDTTPDEIQSLFGKDVLSIIKSETEDKSKSWIDRKLETISHLRTASIEAKLVCCADKLSNMRSIYADQKAIGEKAWERFNADKENIKMYYKGILAAISDISDRDMYCDLSELIEIVFHLDSEVIK